MNQSSVTPGEMFGGKLQELVTDKIDDATRDFKARKMINQEIIREKLKELIIERSFSLACVSIA